MVGTVYVGSAGGASFNPDAASADSQARKWLERNPPQKATAQAYAAAGKAPPVPVTAPVQPLAAPGVSPVNTTQVIAKPSVMKRTAATVGAGLAANAILPNGSALADGVNAALVPATLGLGAPVSAVAGTLATMDNINNKQAQTQGFADGKTFGAYRQGAELARDQDRKLTSAAEQLARMNLNPQQRADYIRASGLNPDGTAPGIAASFDAGFDRTGGVAPQKIQAQTSASGVAAAPLPTLTPGEAARFGVPSSAGQSAPYAEPAPVAQFKAGQIQTQNAPHDPAAWTAENPSTFGAAPGVQVARKQYGNDTVRMLKDAKGKVTFTNAQDAAGMRAFETSAPSGVSNVTNGDGTPYTKEQRAADQARGDQAQRELHYAKMADVHGGDAADYAPGGKFSDNPSAETTLNGMMKTAKLAGTKLKLAELLSLQQQMKNNQQQQQSELALRAPGMQLDNAGKALTLQSHQELASLQQKYLGLNEENDKGGAQRKSLAAQILTLQGKTPPDKFKVVEVGGGIDPGTMQALPKTAYLLDQGTGQYQPFGDKPATPPKYPDGTELIGKNSKKYVVQNGQPVLKG